MSGVSGVSEWSECVGQCVSEWSAWSGCVSGVSEWVSEWSEWIEGAEWVSWRSCGGRRLRRWRLSWGAWRGHGRHGRHGRRRDGVIKARRLERNTRFAAKEGPPRTVLVVAGDAEASVRKVEASISVAPRQCSRRHCRHLILLRLHTGSPVHKDVSPVGLIRDISLGSHAYFCVGRNHQVERG